MPSYKVTTPRFYGGKLYGPGTRRPILDTEEKFKKLPEGLVLLKGETATQAKARRASEANSVKAAEKSRKADEVDVDSANFLGADGGSVVETL
ncbi:hypothetical protein [Porticoccus sp.]